jgi:rod shape-determining protein MreB and related proteins
MRLRSGVAIDLGTVNTLVYVAGRGIVAEEPTAIAISRATGRVVAVGAAADALSGKEPQDVEVIHPLRDGVIADLDATVAMLQAFLRQAQVRRRIRKTMAVVCLPVEATYIERRSVAAAVEALRPRCTVQLVDEPVAAAVGAGFDPQGGSGVFIVDIGGGTTEVAVMAGGHVVRARSLRVGRNAARNLKMTLGLADGSVPEAETVGVDVARRVPRVQHISAKLVAAAIEPSVAAIASEVELLLSDIPPNLAEEVVRGKIRLAGGGALLPGLAFRIETAADIAVMVVEDPLRCVIRGAARLLEIGKVPASGRAA